MLDISFDPIWALKQGYTVVADYVDCEKQEYAIINGQLMTRHSFLLSDGYRTCDEFEPCSSLKFDMDAIYSLIPPEPPI